MSLDRAARTRVAELMTRAVVTVAPRTALRDALAIMVEANVGSVIVTDVPRGRPLRRADVRGMVPVFFALRESVRGGDAQPVEVAMFRDWIEARADESIGAVLPRITNNKTWRLIVTEGDDVAGLLSATDIVRLLGDAAHTEERVEIGVDTSFFKIDIAWEGTTARFRRGDEYVTDVQDVVALTSECRELPESEQSVMLLRLRSAGGDVRALFLDADPVQSNVREIAPHIERLDDVFDWLLDPGYVHRQGDVGIYPAPEVPRGARDVSVEEYPDVFEPVLSKRHQLSPATACDFMTLEERLFVRVREAARLIHPEHHAIALGTGLYEIRGARGVPLPSFSGLRAFESSALGER